MICARPRYPKRWPAPGGAAIGLALALLLAAAAPAASAPAPGADSAGSSAAPDATRGATPGAVRITGSVVEPAAIPLPPSDQDLAGRLSVPEGFEVEVYARDLINPRMLAYSPDGVLPDNVLYVTRRQLGDVVMLRQGDDGATRAPVTVASRPGLHGIAFDGNRVYLATVRDVYVADVLADGSFGRLERIIDDLPDGGQHANRSLAVGPDGMLYISVGSSCNACDETNPEHATILRATPDGRSRTIFASGLRNTIGFDWQPGTGALYGLDHGIDWLGDDGQMEEVNRIEQGRRYGWPHVVDFNNPTPRADPPQGMSIDDWIRLSTPAVAGYTAHAAPMQMAFHDGHGMPADVAGDAFAAMRGSWNRQPPSGYEVVRIDFDNGKLRGITPFLTGFLVSGQDGGHGMLGRPTGIAIAPDGAIMVADDTQGVIYRISAEGKDGAPTAPPRTPVPQKPVPQKLAPQNPAMAEPVMALDHLAPDGAAELALTAGFSDGGTIPDTNRARGDDASPALTWEGAPESARSFAVIMEDAAATDPAAPSGQVPFVHWIIHDIPADLSALREGLPTHPRLQDPEGARQGTNSRGSIGYTGPRPPAGDRPHPYQITVLALDVERLDVPPMAGRQAVLDAMTSHVVAAGRMVGHAAP
ncbi:YbhB/YbcL family Raf kinase inhibitor-like protein (plasmid) [Tistrella bauzanensis]|uniref:YbhB/YbcL family Raf kinase inhibitor-like protein n=1 Tax=Tistrella TaxID=171436 RepID=UPI0031F709BC